MMKILEIAILIFQSIILLEQFLLSRKINNQSSSKEKGYFLPEKSNINKSQSFTDMFDLNYPIDFYIAGKDDIIVKGIDISVNGNWRKTDPIPGDTYFARDSRFGFLDVMVPLIEKDFQNTKNEICIRVKCENTRGYLYTEVVEMTLSKENEKHWRMIKFNLTFE